MWKNVLPVYGAGIRNHDLWNMSLLPWPLEQGFSDNIRTTISIATTYETRQRLNLNDRWLVSLCAAKIPTRKSVGHFGSKNEKFLFHFLS